MKVYAPLTNKGRTSVVFMQTYSNVNRTPYKKALQHSARQNAKQIIRSESLES